ncbi:MAG TPA: hypothetical protein V6D33_18895 [Cyanophyceae cyanobacterium]
MWFFIPKPLRSGVAQNQSFTTPPRLQSLSLFISEVHGCGVRGVIRLPWFFMFDSSMESLESGENLALFEEALRANSLKKRGILLSAVAQRA